MPTANIGEKTSLDRREFLELKGKGEKATIRLAGTKYHYDGKHFLKTPEGEWNVIPCPRINEELKCEHCEEYFKVLKKLKEAKEAKDSDLVKKFEDERRKVGPAISFYYPVVDRETHLSAIFKTTLMVRLALEEKVSEGVDVLDVDFVVKRTEKPGSYYSLGRVDSAETPDLTKDEEAELGKAKELNLAEIVGGKKGKMEFEPNVTEDLETVPESKEKVGDVNPDDIPF